jgi:DNA-binding NtrC family response regulator
VDDPTKPVRTTELAVALVRVARAGSGPAGGAEAVGERTSVGSAEGNALRLDDRGVSRFHLEVAATPGGIEVVDLGSTNGTWLGPVRVQRALVPSGTTLRVGGCELVVADAGASAEALPDEEQLSGLRGRSMPMKRLMTKVRSVATSNVAVLVTGESGTGKELVARAIHDLGARAAGPFEVVDCGALVPTLVASELFGHERGAFSGADTRHVGAFERASGGTLFLDEIGELPMGIQSALLGALERKRVRRLGAKTDVAIDVRVVAATHRDLRSEVNEGRFRLDLFYRLAVVTLQTPPLRQRPDDIALLADHFLRQAGRTEPLAHWLSPEALRSLESRPFEGNVRELRNLIEALVALGELPDASDAASSDPADAAPGQAALRSYREARDDAMSRFEREYIAALMTLTAGNASRAARLAHMDRSHLLDLLRKHGLR